MRIMPVSNYSVNRKSFVVNNQSVNHTKNNEPVFKAATGKIAGALLGGAAAVGLALVAAPVLIVTAPTLGVIGAIAGDEAEKKITGKKEDNK